MGDHLLDAVGEIDEPLGARVADDALHVQLHLVGVLPGLQIPFLLIGEVLELRLLPGGEELSVSTRFYSAPSSGSTPWPGTGD